MSTRRRAVVSGAVVLVALALVGALAAWTERESGPRGTNSGAAAAVVAADTRFLDRPGDAEVTVVEFIDFECEVCRAFYPEVERLREQYGDRVAFALRYFPMPGHSNSVPAALAVEAAAQQDHLEEMYRMLLERQDAWGESGDVDRAPLFREYAAELGLDMAAYDAAVGDDATVLRVAADFETGRALGVDGTPTFFVDGEPVELASYGDLERAIAAALHD
ncbi:disulfide bond formation protein DsbA [Aeromicrobium phragmitis]|uniref:Disulfide bond formation protein DsbA n=1 Tax=Aeromicrobium phragmitis TaxID=2478914 RepID=A0A3L8PP36_9ACTN|nr:thioredoxin domain-containing protein [Aeromicrobium phragmitis]RLV56944.1 disulfide bond formation protein DsbA [Aeromicrobium phragmitis]